MIAYDWDNLNQLDQWIEEQAAFITGLTPDKLPPSAVRAAKRIVLDSIGCMAAGVKALDGSISEGGTAASLSGGSHTVVGRAGSCSKEWAAFANGCSFVATELDEGHTLAKGHPAAHFLPALLAEAEELQCSGEQFLTAFIAAYETAVRWGRAVTLRSEVHTHGNWGTISAAAAVAKLRGLTQSDTAEAMRLAVSMPMPSAWASAFTGMTVRNGYIGASNMLGLMAPSMLSLGIRSNSAVISQLYNEIIGAGLAGERLAEGLGESFYIEQNYMKTYACCRYIHGAADAVSAMQSKGLATEMIASVTVETYTAAARLDDPQPLNALAAKFSIPYSVALLLLKGSLEPQRFAEASFPDLAVMELASRVRVAEDKELTALLPETRATRVTVELRDGLRISEEIRAATGEHNNPLRDGQLEHKFHSLSGGSWDEQRRADIMQAVYELDELEDATILIEKLSI